MENYVHFPFVLSHGCCTPEIENAISSTYDWSRMGVEPEVSAPNEANLLIVAGWINEQMVEDLKKVYSSLVGRRMVMAVGACAIGGGPYTMSQSKVVKASDILPVDVYVPGCPPRPEALIDAIRLLKEKLKPGPNKTAVLYAAIRETSRD